MSKLLEGIIKSYKAHGEDRNELRKIQGHLAEGFKSGHIRPSEVNLTEAFIECFGNQSFNAYRREQNMSAGEVFRESGAVMTTAFSNITSQLLATTFMEAYDIPDRVFMKLIPTVTTNRQTERIAGITLPGDETMEVNEGDNYPQSGVAEDWVDTPVAKKFGQTSAVTKETIIFDQTGLVVDRVRTIGDFVGLYQEKMAIDCIIDGNRTRHRYNWQGTIYASYGDTPWDNLSASTPLVNFQSVDTAEQLLAAIVDPATGEPQNVTIKHMIYPRGLQLQAAFALAPQVSMVTPGYATSANPTRTTEIPNPLLRKTGPIQEVTSQLLNARHTAASIANTTWYVGDVTQYAEYRQIWPVTFDQLSNGTQLEFDRDIVLQFKASGMGSYRVKNPRKMVKCTA